MKLFAFFSASFLLFVGAVLILQNKNSLVGKMPTSNFKRKALLVIKEENSMQLIIGLAILDNLLLWLVGYCLFS